jgi:hypothetical protein
VSTILYARLTGKVESSAALLAATAGDQTSAQQVAALAQRVAALVPSEALLLYGIALASATQKAEDGSITISDPQLLKWAVPILALACVAMYALAKSTKWLPVDFLRLIIPPGAFVAWTLFESTSGLTLWSWFSGLGTGWSFLVGGLIGMLLLALSGRLTPKA